MGKMTGSCIRCAKKFCEKRGEIDFCGDIITITRLALQDIDKNLKEPWNDPVYTLKKHR